LVQENVELSMWPPKDEPAPQQELETQPQRHEIEIVDRWRAAAQTVIEIRSAPAGRIEDAFGRGHDTAWRAYHELFADQIVYDVHGNEDYDGSALPQGVEDIAISYCLMAAVVEMESIEEEARRGRKNSKPFRRRWTTTTIAQRLTHDQDRTASGRHLGGPQADPSNPGRGDVEYQHRTDCARACGLLSRRHHHGDCYQETFRKWIVTDDARLKRTTKK